MVPLLRAANVKIFRIRIHLGDIEKPRLTFDLMHLAVDIGNTRIKWALFQENELLENGQLDSSDTNGLNRLIEQNASTPCTACSAVAFPKEVSDSYVDLGIQFIDHSTPVPIINRYATPETLGTDRLCAAIGGKGHYPEHPVLVIDVGTCIKYEFVSVDGIYEGGNISPGMQMRFAALNHYTSKLPKLTPLRTEGLYGRSTEEALRLGVQQGMLFEIQAMIDATESLHPSVKVVGTGGDLSFFAYDLKTHIFADPLLVLRGINEIYLHNS